MNKRNTMVLTLIAVATLMIAVIGASFAYFNVLGNSKTTTTNITGTMPTVGAVGTTGGATLYLNPTAANMSYSGNGKTTLYAGTDATEALKTAAQHHVLATMQVTGGLATTKYTCSGTITISLPADSSGNNTIKDAITAGNLFVDLAGSGVTVTDGTAIDLFNAKTANITKNFTYTLTGTTATATVTGDLYLKNTTSDQKALAGKTIKVTITVTTTTCNVA